MNEKIKSRILIAEDFITVKKLVKDILREMGFPNENIYMANNGAEAKQLMEEIGFSLVISDWNMPIMDGLELLKTIRAEEKTKFLPFIMLSGENKFDKVFEAANAGATAYLLKPFKPFEFSQILKKIFKPSEDFSKIRWTKTPAACKF